MSATKQFQCIKCDFSVWKVISGRLFAAEEVETLIREKQVGPLQGFRSKMGKPFAAVLRFNAENKVEFDFGQDQRDGNGAEVDFSGQEPVGTCLKCGSRVFELPMSYICEKAVGPNRTCDFRSGKVILQQQVDRAQMQKLLETGKTDLLQKFISKKGRPFKAFLAFKEGKVGFEFEPRVAKGKAGAKTKAKRAAEPEAKIDFTGRQPLGKCPKCGGSIFETEGAYICERSQADTRRCKVKINKKILEQPIDQNQALKLITEGRTDLLKEFVSSKTGKPFQAFLVMDDTGKVTFDFPPREA